MRLENGRVRWDCPDVNAISDDHCRLTSQDLFKPNTIYEGEVTQDGRVVLTELPTKTFPGARLSKAKALAALEKSPLRFTRSWDELREETRS